MGVDIDRNIYWITNWFYHIKCLIFGQNRGLGYRSTRLKDTKTITQR